jgi:hypothetical protein
MKPKSGLILACSFLSDHGKRRLVFIVLVLVSGILASAVPSRASTVGCSGASGGPFDFTSLTAALNAPGALVNNTISVSGTCAEPVVVAGAQNLQIIGNPGAALVDPGGNPPNFGAVVEIDNSQGVVLQGLTIQVASRSVDTAIPVVLVQSSGGVAVVQCRLEGAGASDGIDMFQSTVRLFGATVIENNNDGQGDGEGVFVEGPNALLALRSNASGCPLIQGNGDNGILATGGGATVRAPLGAGCATIQNNGFAGIFANLGVTIQLGVPQANPGGVKLTNNLYGVAATNGSHFNINGPVLIQGNTVDGIRLRNAFGVLNVSDGTSGPTIQQNGTSLNPPCCAPAAGISLGNNATLDLGGAQVTNNGGPGVIAQDNSSVRLIGPLPLSITHNPIGVEVTDVSSVGLFLAPSVSGNSTADIVCGPDSAAHGDPSAVGKINCPQFRPQQNAVTPPPRNRKVIP